MSLLLALALLHVALAARYIPHLPRIHNLDFQAPWLQHFIDRDPIHRRWIPAPPLDPAGQPPVGHCTAIVGHRPEPPPRIVRDVPSDRYPVARCPYILARFAWANSSLSKGWASTSLNRNTSAFNARFWVLARDLALHGEMVQEPLDSGR